MQSLAFNHNCSRTVGRGWNCSYRSPTYIVRLFEVGFRTRFNSPTSRILFDNLSGLVPTVVMSPGFGPMNLSNYTREPNKTTMMIWPICRVKHATCLSNMCRTSGKMVTFLRTIFRLDIHQNWYWPIAVYCQHWVFHITKQGAMIQKLKALRQRTPMGP